ncbi:MAG: sulfite exporter TauE/SafE family protein [Bacillota bacterium]|nr:sulfite exporter TauE/SafE family protein [Bacillota bacterium]
MMIILIGLLTGIISAMGIGGGAILIPALIFFAGTKQHVAQSVNLISFIPVAAIALIIHYRNNNLDTEHALILIFSGFVGAYIGSAFAVRLPGEILSRLFAVFLFIMGGYEMLYKKK